MFYYFFYYINEYREIQILKHENSVIKSREEQYRKDYENEVRERSKENAEFNYHIKELEEQLQEYEDENANLRAQIQNIQNMQNNIQNPTPDARNSPGKKSNIISEEVSKVNEKPEDLDLKSMLDQNEPSDKTPEQQIAELKKRLK